MTEKEAMEIISHMAMISDLVEGEEHAKERAEAVAMAIVALMVPKEKPTKKCAGMWEDAEGNTGGVLTRYGHDDIDIEWESEPAHVELSISAI